MPRSTQESPRPDSKTKSARVLTFLDALRNAGVIGAVPGKRPRRLAIFCESDGLMPTIPNEATGNSRLRSGRWKIVLIIVAVPCALVAFAAWWFTEPLDRQDLRDLALAKRNPAASSKPVAPKVVDLRWPSERLEGEQAKRFLLDFLLEAEKKLEGVEGYTATFHKQERINGKLGPTQTLALKARTKPFSIYLKFIEPQKGKEVLFAKGRHDDKVIAHGGGWSRRLIPRLAVAPTDKLALADSRHPITDAGLLNLARKLVRFRKMDLNDVEAITVLDSFTDENGRAWYRSIHEHPNRTPERPFARVEVLYDPATKLPVRITNFDWPKPGRQGPLELAEHYSYDDLKLSVPLTDLDFDPANPAYEFRRY